MKRLAISALAVFVMVATTSAESVEDRARYEYARLVITSLKGSPRSDDDFRWSFPSSAGETTSVFRTSQAEIREYFDVNSKEDAEHGVLNRICGLGWRLVSVHRVESYKENGIWTPFLTYYHFVRAGRPNKPDAGDGK